MFIKVPAGDKPSHSNWIKEGQLNEGAASPGAGGRKNPQKLVLHPGAGCSKELLQLLGLKRWRERMVTRR